MVIHLTKRGLLPHRVGACNIKNLNVSSLQGLSCARPSYGIKCVGRIVTKSMSKICSFCHLIMGDCDYA